MRRLAFALLCSVSVFSLACGEDPEEPNAFQTQGNNDEIGDSDTSAPEDLPAESGESTSDSGTDTTTESESESESDSTTTTTSDTGGDCGNGVIDDGEQCDGGNLNGFTCTELGYAGGTLACDPLVCTYDASGCTADPTTTQGGTSG